MLTALAVPASAAELRVALVIGNAAYAAAPLANPLNDARAMSEALKGMGFSVVEVRDAKKADMEQAIVQVRDALKDRRGVGLLYYAGHGLQLDWRNYMVPVDAKLANARDVREQAVDVQQVVDAFKSAGNRMNIVVLDACRDNPFGGSSSGKGLAQMDAPPGTFLAFSTAPGNVAEDGDAKQGNSLYTAHLVKEIQQPQTRIEDVFKRVRFEVRRSSAGRQIPWESTSLEDDFSFSEGVMPVVGQSIQERRREFEQQLIDWRRIQDSRNVDDVFEFLKRYPSGMMSEQALARLERLSRARVESAPTRDPGSARRVVDPQFQRGDRFVYDEYDAYGASMPARDLRVTNIDAGKVFLNEGQEIWDELGNLIKDRCCSREPAKGYMPSELVVGKAWRSAYRAVVGVGGNALFWDFRVAALEDVSVPAGTFKAYRVEGSGWVPAAGAYQTQTYWIDAKSFVIVKDVWMRRTNARIDDGYRREMREMRRAHNQFRPEEKS